LIRKGPLSSLRPPFSGRADATASRGIAALKAHPRRTSTVSGFTVTRETLGPAPSTVMGMRLCRSNVIGNVVGLSMVAPQGPSRRYLNDIARQATVNRVWKDSCATAYVWAN